MEQLNTDLWIGFKHCFCLTGLVSGAKEDTEILNPTSPPPQCRAAGITIDLMNQLFFTLPLTSAWRTD